MRNAPRGRVNYDAANGAFTLFADRCPACMPKHGKRQEEEDWDF